MSRNTIVLCIAVATISAVVGFYTSIMSEYQSIDTQISYPRATQSSTILASKLSGDSVVIKYSTVLKMAHVISVDTHVPPEITQAILIQESKAGKTSSLVGSRNGGVGNRSYGVMQLKVEAARSVMSRYPKLVSKYFPNRPYSSIVDEEIIALLLTNHESNIRIACYQLVIYHNILQDWDSTIAAYNMGIGNAIKHTTFEDNTYLQSVHSIMNTTVTDFNNNNI